MRLKPALLCDHLIGHHDLRLAGGRGRQKNYIGGDCSKLQMSANTKKKFKDNGFTVKPHHSAGSSGAPGKTVRAPGPGQSSLSSFGIGRPSGTDMGSRTASTTGPATGSGSGSATGAQSRGGRVVEAEAGAESGAVLHAAAGGEPVAVDRRLEKQARPASSDRWTVDHLRFSNWTM